MNTFEWDENKRQTNIRKHDVDFVEILELFNGRTLIQEGDRYAYDEQRFQALGMTKGVVYFVVFTMRGDSIRIISARHAKPKERKIYGTFQ